MVSVERWNRPASALSTMIVFSFPTIFEWGSVDGS
jgi:hypothetical protein